MWCPICLITMQCLVLRTKSHVIDWVFLLWGGRRKEVWIFCFQQYHTPPLFISMTPTVLCFLFCNLFIINAFLLFFPLFLPVHSTILLSSLSYPFLWSPSITSLFSPGSCLLIPHPEIIVKCLRPYTFSVITTIQDSFCKTDYPSLWKIALNSSCPSFFIL